MALSEHFSDFFGETEHFCGKNGALRWGILVGKQKHKVQKPSLKALLVAFVLTACLSNSTCRHFFSIACL